LRLTRQSAITSGDAVFQELTRSVEDVPVLVAGW
jgi:hypothetical protein